VKENQVEISADPSGQNLSPDGKFVGTFSGSGITGQFHDLSQLPSSWPVHKLRRKRATWQGALTGRSGRMPLAFLGFDVKAQTNSFPSP
jgi:hypothetical protein